MRSVGIFIVVFNISNLISTQLDLIKKFCKDDQFDIIVIDNSNDHNVSQEIKKHVVNNSCIYDNSNNRQCDFSQSHAAACNYTYEKFNHSYEYMFFLDHDNFPIKNFSVKTILMNKVAGGLGQIRKDKTYFWPGCVMFNNNNIKKSLINFSIHAGFGLDTGGMLYKIIEKYNTSNCVFFDQKEVKNNLFVEGFYNFYNIIENAQDASQFSFMHFLNSSNWNNKEKHNERITSLLSILKTYTD